MLINEITKDLDNITPDKLQLFVKEMTASLLQLKDRLYSTDPKVREEAVLSAIELRDSLEQEMGKLAGKVQHQPSALDPSYAPVQEEIDRLKELFEVKQ